MSWSSDHNAATARLAGALERQAEDVRLVHAEVARDSQAHVHLLRPDDVAARLAKSRAWVYRNQHALGGFRVGGQVRFDPQVVEGYLDRCRNGGTQRLAAPDAPPLLPIKPTRRADGGERRPPRPT